MFVETISSIVLRLFSITTSNASYSKIKNGTLDWKLKKRVFHNKKGKRHSSSKSKKIAWMLGIKDPFQKRHYRRRRRRQDDHGDCFLTCGLLHPPRRDDDANKVYGSSTGLRCGFQPVTEAAAVAATRSNYCC